MVEVINPAAIKRRAAADHSVNLVALVQQLTGHVGAVLPGDPSN